MYIEAVKLHNFRNYSQLELTLDERLNFFVGENAQGKTNLLEALFFAATGRSFRTRNDEELIRWGQDSCEVAVRVVHKRGAEKLHLLCRQNPKQKLYSSNGLQLPRADYLGRLYPVLFTPEDLAIVKGAPQQRRKFFDEQISKIYPIYEIELKRFSRVLRQRNRLLKLRQEKSLGSPELESWNEQLAVLGARIMQRRLFALRRLSLLSRLAHRRLTGGEETLVLQYQSAVPLREGAGEDELQSGILAVLREQARREARLGQTLVGPHRDDVRLLINGKSAHLYASQGQQRTLVLALKLAEIEFIRGESGEFPLLLLDDVFSELDGKRRKLLVESIEGRVQTMLTATAAERFAFFRRSGKLFTITRGEVFPSESHL
ncbi:MAG TPA: DNA replication/repair protein RecF [Firmicutes bacterium]|nr:DNA replication/repair protein RecF [Bacillota bacterium]